MYRRLAPLLLLGVLFGCGGSPNPVSATQPAAPSPRSAPARSTYSVSGVVSDSATSLPLVDVVVEWEDAMDDGPMWKGTRTLATGTYQLSVAAVPSIVIRVRKPGYVDQTAMLHVEADTTVNFALAAAASTR